MTHVDTDYGCGIFGSKSRERAYQRNRRTGHERERFDVERWAWRIAGLIVLGILVF